MLRNKDLHPLNGKIIFGKDLQKFCHKSQMQFALMLESHNVCLLSTCF